MLGYEVREYVYNERLFPGTVDEQGNIVAFSHVEVSVYVLRSRYTMRHCACPGRSNI